MLYEIRQTGIAAKLITIAAMLALSLGVIFIGIGQAYATHAEPEIYKMEVTVDAPVVGEAPASEATIEFFDKDGNKLPNNPPDDDYSTSISWSEVGSTFGNSLTKFEVDKTYKVTCQANYYEWHKQLAECPGLVEGAQGFVNGKLNNTEQKTAHAYISQIHMINTYYKWTLHEVTFNSNGGSGDMAAQTVYEDEGTKLSKNTFAFDGQKFTGWNTKADGSGKAYADEEPVDLKESTTLYAQWAPATYKVTVTADPAEGGTASADKQEAAKGDTVTLSVSPKDGYEFVEWVPVTEGVTIKDGKFTMPASDVEVKATFKEKPQPKPQPITVTHTVTFDANGGTGAMDPLTGEEGTEVALTANKFARTGYTFKGWNTKADGSGTAYADKATVKLDSDITLYAQWTKNASSSSSTKATNSTKSSSSNTLAKTGDFTPFAIGGIALIALLAAGALVLARFRRHE